MDEEVILKIRILYKYKIDDLRLLGVTTFFEKNWAIYKVTP